jgi:hypothetical protein
MHYDPVIRIMFDEPGGKWSIARTGARRARSSSDEFLVVQHDLSVFQLICGPFMMRLPRPLKYLSELTPGKVALWCYLIWYLVTVVLHFDPSPGIWLSSFGISAVVGIALLLSVRSEPPALSDRWQTFRLFLMPFCVSSFSALIKDQGYILVLPSRSSEFYLSFALCAVFVLFVYGLKRTQRGTAA